MLSIMNTIFEQDEEKWIQQADVKKGALHRQLGIPEDERIPISKLEEIKDRLHKIAEKRKLTKSELKLLRRVNFALNVQS